MEFRAGGSSDNKLDKEGFMRMYGFLNREEGY